MLECSYIFKIWSKMDLRILHFPTSLQVKRPRPKGKKMRMDHPFILGFCHLSLLILYLLSFFHFLVKTHFPELLSYFNSFVYLRFKYGNPQIIIISKYNFHFKLIILSQRYIPNGRLRRLKHLGGFTPNRHTATRCGGFRRV